MISVVVPVLDEGESLAILHDEIAKVRAEQGLDLETIFVDDGSQDDSWSVIRSRQAKDSRVRGLRFRRNFGKAAALSAGVRAAQGDIIITLDGDLQDDPAEIPRLLAKLNEGFDVVSGWKQTRHDPWHKVWPSRAFNFLVGAITGVHLHDHNCGMKCYRSEVFREVRLYGELHRFIPVLAAARGFRVAEIPIAHRPRRLGRSKYGVRRFVKGFLDLLTVKFLTSYSRRPQHFLGTVGLLGFLAGTLTLLYLTVTWFIRLWHPDWFPPLHQRALFPFAIASLLFGTQLMSIGFLAELLTAYHGRDTDTYSVAEEV